MKHCQFVLSVTGYFLCLTLNAGCIYCRNNVEDFHIIHCFITHSANALSLNYYLVAFLSCTVHGYTKRWMWSTDWNDPKNWDRQRVPCATDEIVLADVSLTYFV